VPPRRSGSLVAPQSARLLNACKVMPYLPQPVYLPNYQTYYLLIINL
jgi:hypothetical protein